MPRGGFYLWCRFPDGQDSATLARRAVSENVVLAPGNVFSVSQTAFALLRFNVAQANDPISLRCSGKQWRKGTTDKSRSVLRPGRSVPEAIGHLSARVRLTDSKPVDHGKDCSHDW
jgi:hypothetical protein